MDQFEIRYRPILAYAFVFFGVFVALLALFTGLLLGYMASLRINGQFLWWISLSFFSAFSAIMLTVFLFRTVRSFLKRGPHTVLSSSGYAGYMGGRWFEYEWTEPMLLKFGPRGSLVF